MSQGSHPSPNPSAEDPDLREDATLDLSLDDTAELDDLQALADSVADITGDPERSKVRRDQPILDVPDASGRIIEELEREVQEANERVRLLERLEDEHHDKHRRLLADFNNHRNRTQREIQMAVDLSEKKLLLELLPVLDSFDRCIASSYQGLEDFRSGVNLIQKQFLDALRRLGVAPVELNPGDPFDANHAEALTTAMDPTLPDGAVAAIYERGFQLRDQLLRPARVVVNHHPDGPNGGLQ